MGLSRADISALARRAGFSISTTTVNRLEDRGRGVAGRGLSEESLAWLESLLGLRDQNADWSVVEPGAPVVIEGEKGNWQFQSFSEKSATVKTWGGEHNRERFREFPEVAVRLVAPTTLPDPAAPVFHMKRGGGVKGLTQAARVLAHMRETGGAHGVGAIAYSLGLGSITASKVAAHLVREGQLKKVGRGVFVLVEDPPPVSNGNGHRKPAGLDPKSRREALAERVGAALDTGG